MPVDQILTSNTFSTVGGGMIFVTIVLFMIRKAAADTNRPLTPVQTLFAQALLTTAWSIIAVSLFMEGPMSTRISAVLIMALSVMAAQTGAYEWFKAIKGLGAQPLQLTTTHVESDTARWAAAENQVADGGDHTEILRAWDDAPTRDHPADVIADPTNRGGQSRVAGDLPPMPPALL